MKQMILALFVPALLGQVRDPGDFAPARGIVPTGTYSIDGIEKTNPANGNMMLSIPLAQLPANRGGVTGFELKLEYNSALYDFYKTTANKSDAQGQPVLTTELQASLSGGWQYNAAPFSLDSEPRPGTSGLSCAPADLPVTNPLLTNASKLTLTMADGSRHLLRLAGQSDANNDGYFPYGPNGVGWKNCAGQAPAPLTGDTIYYTTDSTYITVRVNAAGCTGTGQDPAPVGCPWTAYFPDGSGVMADAFYAPNYTLVSRAGNRTTISHASTQTTYTSTIQDEAQRSITLSQSAGQPDVITAPGFNGATLTTTVTRRSVGPGQRQYVCSAGAPDNTCWFAAGANAVDTIQLPRQLCDNPAQSCGLGYQFGYDTDNAGQGIGELASVTTPWGSKTVYRYQMDASGGSGYGWADYLRNRLTGKTLSPAANEPYGWPAETVSYYENPSAPAQCTVTAADGAATVYKYVSPFPLDNSSLNSGVITEVDNADGSVTASTWATNSPPGANGVYNNPYLQTESGTVAGLTSMRKYGVDLNGNVTSVAEYDFTNTVTPARTTLNTYLYPAASYGYYTGSAAVPVWRAAVSATEVRAGGVGGTLNSRVEYGYTGTNLTQQRRWDSARAASPPATLDTNSASVTDYGYDSYGNVTGITQPGRTRNQYNYDVSGTYLTRIDKAYGTGVQISSTFVRDPSSGLVTGSVADTVNNVSTVTEYDDLGRPVKVREAAGTGVERQTAIGYSLQQRRVITRKDKNLKADGALITAQYFDSRGRVWRTRQVEDGNPASTGGVLTDTQHFLSGVGRCSMTSNPYRAADPGNATVGWTLTNFDRVDRPTTVWSFAGAAAPVCGEGNANPTTGHSTTTYDTAYALPGSKFGLMTQVTDQAGKVRQTVSDAMGRVVAVNEDPLGSLHYTTSYQYDAMDDLTGVVQGAQTRTFTYDSLKRLSSSQQPEMNPKSYTYTSDGLVSTRTDGNGAVTNYSYDALNRPTVETHSGNAASGMITRCYDGLITNGNGGCQAPAVGIVQAHGRLTESLSNGSLTRYSQFDELGNVRVSQQTTNGSQPYVFQYSYDLAGQPTAVTYPSGRTLTTAYNYLEQPVGVTGSIAGSPSTAYAGNASYAAAGGLASMVVNGSWVETWNYNSRLQATGVSAGAGFSLSVDYGGSANNGNVASQTVTRGGVPRTQSFAYDGVNRLATAAEGANWSQSYGYDRYGNRWVGSSAGYGLSTYTPVAASNFDAANRFVMAGVTYDLAGNQTQLGAGLAMSYDADGRMATSTLNGATTNYVYDADGRRVLKQTGSVATTYIYDAFGKLAMEVGGTPSACTTCFLTVDPLGSTRQTVNGSGVAVGCHDYLPFGEELNGIGGRSGGCWGIGDTTLKFTGKQRDPETVSSGMTTGLDYFGARYFSGAQGRFTSADQPLIDQDPSNPQSWNLYSYGRNNPLRYVDPSGRCSKAAGGYTDEGNELFAGACANGIIGDNTPQTVNALDISQRGTDLFVNGRIGYEGGIEHDYAADFGFLSLIRGAFGGILGGTAAESAGPPLFDLAPIARGNAIEQALGANLPRTFPTIDKFVNGVATSIKSIDLRAVTYQNPGNLARLLTNYVDKVAEFQGGAVGQATVKGAEITGRVLEVAVPQGGIGAAQQAAINSVVSAAAQKGVQVILIPIR